MSFWKIATAITLLASLAFAGCGGTSEKVEKSLDQQLDDAFALKDYAARANRLSALAGKLGEAKQFSARDRALKGAVASADLVTDAQIRAGVQIRAATELARAEQVRAARDLLDKVREGAQKLEDPAGKVGVLSRCATALGEMPNTGDAIAKCCQEALKIVEGLSDPLEKSRHYATIAGAAGKASESSLADDCLAKARESAAAAGDEVKQIIAEGEIAAALARLERTDDANQAFAAVRAKAEAIEDPLSRANTQITLCKQLRSAKRLDEAGEVLAVAEKSMQKIKSPSDQLMVKEELKKLQKK